MVLSYVQRGKTGSLLFLTSKKMNCNSLETENTGTELFKTEK